MSRTISFLSICFACSFASVAQEPLPVNGVNDRGTYTDRASFAVPTAPGHTYLVLLDGRKVPADVTNVVNAVDYHEISVWRTNAATLEVTNRLVRFIVQASTRGNPEKGLTVWTPYPPISATEQEFAGAQLHIVAPVDYPAGLPIPIVAWVDDGAGRVRRANGWVSAPGFESSDFRLLRGHGFGFLPSAMPGAAISYNPRLPGIQSGTTINIDSSTVWTEVAGTLAGAVTWPANARIHLVGNIAVPAGSTLTIGAGAIVKINPLVNITNSGVIRINGTTQLPVVFTSQNRVAPEQHADAWGGFILRGASAQLIANGAIMTGAGGTESFSFSPGASHRPEQALLLVHSGARAFLTNCFLINNAGQIGNGYNSDITYDHCLLQRAITAGEYVGGTIIINDSAVIEFPSVDGVYNAQIADADYDGIYFTTGTHILRNSLFGFAKDDAIDSGSGGAGTVLVTNCWVESALHEALAWSGQGRVTWTYDTVLMNSGQGIEAGWTTNPATDTNNITPPSPNVFAERLLSTGNSVGARFGDNYDWGYRGFLRLTNSLILRNYRDVFAKTWNTGGVSWDTNRWIDRLAQMDLRSNFITRTEANFPDNFVWDPARDAERLVPFMSAPPEAAVGIGFAVWTNEYANRLQLFEGVPVRLSSFTTNHVSVRYQFWSGSNIFLLHNGTLTFAPGETVKRIFPAGFVEEDHGLIQVTLDNPVNGQLTGETNVGFYGGASPTFQVSVALLRNQADLLRLAEGIAIRLSRPSSHDLSFGYRFEAAGGVLREGLRTIPPGETLVWLPSIDPTGHELVKLSVRDGSGATFLTGMTNIYFVRFAPITQGAPEIIFGFFNGQLTMAWTDSRFVIEEADDVTGPWTTVSTGSPLVIDPVARQKFYRLKR